MKKLTDYWAPWCQPCKIMSPLVDELAEELGIEVEKVNVDENQARAGKAGVMGIPTFILEEDGKQIGKTVGSMSKAEFKKFLVGV